MKKVLATLLMILAFASGASGQITVPNVLQAGATIRAAELNTNFDDIATKALNRISGGTIEGNITVATNITVDGVDLSDFLLSTGEVRGGTAGTVAAPTFSIVGDTGTGWYFPAASQLAAALGGVQRLLLDASGLTIYGNNIINNTGKIPAISSTYFASLDGSALTNITAASAVNFTGLLAGDVEGAMGTTSIAAGVIVNADVSATAGIVDTKLATISTAGKVSNSATTASSANTASSIVARDASGNFAAGTTTHGAIVTSGFQLAATPTNGFVLTSDASGNGSWQAAPSGTVGGGGTIGTLAKFSAATTLADSLVTESGTTVTVGGTFSAIKSQAADSVFSFENNEGSGLARTILRVTGNGVSTGDQVLSFSTTGVLEWVMGQDVSDTGTFKIGTGSSLEGATKLSITSGGLVTVGTIKITGGTPGAGKLLTSDADGDASWTTPSTVPSGMIALFDASCPSGWTRFAALDSRFPRGATTYGATGGADSHGHTGIADTTGSGGGHSHTFGPVTSSTDGSHTHTGTTDVFTASMSVTVPGGASAASSHTHGFTTGSSGSHTHTVSGSTASQANHTHSYTPDVNDSGNLPPYINVIYCKKD